MSSIVLSAPPVVAATADATDTAAGAGAAAGAAAIVAPGSSASVTGRAVFFSTSTMPATVLAPLAAATSSPAAIPTRSACEPASTDLSTIRRTPAIFVAVTEMRSFASEITTVRDPALARCCAAGDSGTPDPPAPHISTSVTGRPLLFSTFTMPGTVLSPFAAVIISPAPMPSRSASEPASVDFTMMHRTPSIFFAVTEMPSLASVSSTPWVLFKAVPPGGRITGATACDEAAAGDAPPRVRSRTRVTGRSLPLSAWMIAGTVEPPFALTIRSRGLTPFVSASRPATHVLTIIRRARSTDFAATESPRLSPWSSTVSVTTTVRGIASPPAGLAADFVFTRVGRALPPASCAILAAAETFFGFAACESLIACVE